MNLREYLREKPTLNPYYYTGYALYQLADRMLWDLNPLSWISRRRLREVKDRHAGGKAVILCNGPSLLKTDFSLLTENPGVFTFGLNKIDLLFDKTPFRPSCIVAVNRHVIEQNAGVYNATDIPLFLDSFAAGLVRPRRNVVYLHEYSRPRFAKDCSMSVYQGGTVTFVAMQLAFHMGFRRIALVGCDHSFAAKGPRSKTVVAGETDTDHFDPNYFARGMRWQLPDLLQSELAYLLAKDAFESEGGSIVNCTEGGRLEIFSRTGLREFVLS